MGVGGGGGGLASTTQGGIGAPVDNQCVCLFPDGISSNLKTIRRNEQPLYLSYYDYDLELHFDRILLSIINIMIIYRYHITYIDNVTLCTMFTFTFYAEYGYRLN